MTMNTNQNDFLPSVKENLAWTISMQKKNNMKCKFLDETDYCLQKNDYLCNRH